MKLLQQSLLALIVCFSLGVWADVDVKKTPVQYETQKMDFHFYSHRSFYSCHYAEKQTDLVLTALGAQNIKIQCRGGLPHFEHVDVKAEFDSAQPASSSEQKGEYVFVELRFDESCQFNKELVKEILPHFEVDVQKHWGSCWYSKGRFAYELEVLN